MNNCSYNVSETLNNDRKGPVYKTGGTKRHAERGMKNCLPRSASRKGARVGRRMVRRRPVGRGKGDG